MFNRSFPPFDDDDPFILKLLSVICYVLTDPYIIAGAFIGVVVTLLFQIHDKLKVLTEVYGNLP